MPYLSICINAIAHSRCKLCTLSSFLLCPLLTSMYQKHHHSDSATIRDVRMTCKAQKHNYLAEWYISHRSQTGKLNAQMSSHPPADLTCPNHDPALRKEKMTDKKVVAKDARRLLTEMLMPDGAAARSVVGGLVRCR